jgi:biotin carboxyl carrier protein
MAHCRQKRPAVVNLRLEVDGQAYRLDLQPKNGVSHYVLTAETAMTGECSVVEIMPGVCSILLGTKSFTVYYAPNSLGIETFTAGERHQISIADARDRAPASTKQGHVGPVELRAQMPGKIVKVLVELGAAVEAGQDLLVVEAMKMQNELKAPKAGIVTKISVVEGTAVSVGEPLIVVE